MKPPHFINGFQVIEYGFLRTPKFPEGYAPPKEITTPLMAVQNLAICTAKDTGGFYVLCCTPLWGYVTYIFAEEKLTAKNLVKKEFGQEVDLWHEFS